MIARLARWLGVGLAAWLAAAGLACAADGAPTPASAADPARQVLVLLRLPPEHFRPGADYGGGYTDGPSRGAHRRIASRLAREHGLHVASDWPLPLAGVDCFVMDVPAGQSPDMVAAELAHDPGVEWSETMKLYHGRSAATPNDPLFRVQPAALEWRLADLHEIATGRNVRVAVIDSLVERNHPDLAGQVDVAMDFADGLAQDAEAHGTAVAGIIAARENNGLGIAGVAPGAKLMALRACWQPRHGADTSSLCDTLSLAKALHFAISHDAQVINLSLSGPADPLLSRLIDVALGRGATVVAAYDRDLPGGGFPASHTGVVAVADESLGPAPRGVFLAPGRDVPTTQPGGRWYFVNGSSFAAAHVSGLIALARERSSRARGGAALVTSATGGTGGGAIDACATVLRAGAPRQCACARPPPSPAVAHR